MLQASTIQFLRDLTANNNKAWFDEHRKQYETAKADFTVFTDSLISDIAQFDPSISHLQAKDCLFRINRDVRFSKNKDPYKTNMGASISSGGKKISTPGYYFHCEPGQSFVGGGLYMPAPPDLAHIRQELDYNFESWQKIVQNKTFKKHFPEGVDGVEVLSRPPKGYDESNPAIHYLKMKSFIASRHFTDEELQHKNVHKEIAKCFEAMKPMLDFLKGALDN
ncbi:MAG: hypothetical protein RLY16_1924 [Bacteroidota bacterium]